MEAAAVGTPSRDLFTANVAAVRAEFAVRHGWPVGDAVSPQ